MNTEQSCSVQTLEGQKKTQYEMKKNIIALCIVLLQKPSNCKSRSTVTAQTSFNSTFATKVANIAGANDTMATQILAFFTLGSASESCG